MGRYGMWLFGDVDHEIIVEIARAHDLSVEEVEDAYRKMLDDLKKEVSD